MKCPHCGLEHPDSAMYCPITGKDLPGQSANAGNPANITNPSPREPEIETNPFAPRKNNPVFIAAIIVGIFLLIGGGVLIALKFLPNAGKTSPPAVPTASLPTQSAELGILPTLSPTQPATEPAVLCANRPAHPAAHRHTFRFGYLMAAGQIGFSAAQRPFERLIPAGFEHQRRANPALRSPRQPAADSAGPFSGRISGGL